MTDQYFLRAGGKVLGPFNWQQLQDLKQRNRLQPFHDLSSDRMTWVQASTLPELFPPQPEPQGASSTTPAQAPAGDSGEAWYYADPRGQRRGPVSRAQLAELVGSGTVTEDSLVWNKSLSDWRPAGEVAADLFGSAPPIQRSVGGDWRNTRIGLLLAIIAACVYGGSIVMFCVAMLVAAVNSQGDVTFVGLALAMGVMILVTRLVMMASVILETIGFAFCISVPPRTGARPLALTTMILAIAQLVVDFIYAVSALVGGTGAFALDELGFHGGRAAALVILLMVSWLLAVTYRFVFLLFLRTVALACQAAKIAQNLIYLMILFGVFVLISFILMLLIGLNHGQESIAMIILFVGFVIVLLGLGWLAWYIVILFQVRGVTARQR